MKKLLIILFATATFSSCSNFYKVITINDHPTAASVQELRNKQKYFIIRDSMMAYAMTNVSISSDGKSIQSDLIPLPDEHMTHMWRAADEKPTYNKLYSRFLFNEVHLYTLPDSNRTTGHYTLPLSNVSKTELIQKDTVRTRRNHTRSVILGVGGTVVVAAIIGAAVVSSQLSNW